MEYLRGLIPSSLINFILVLLFSFSLGLEQRKRLKTNEKTFGTDRTFTFIGVLAFLLFSADPVKMVPYLTGFLVIGALLIVYYYAKAMQEKRYGITSIVLGLICYGFPLLVANSPRWLSLLFFVIVLMMAAEKQSLQRFGARIAADEFTTFAKFIIIAGVVLPLLPQGNLANFIPVSPYKIWLAVVVVSAISYLSYLLRKYAFPNAGLLLTAILGGLYSSTASTVILARKSKEDDSQPKAYAGAIIMATAMMFLRIFVLLLIFNMAVAVLSLPYFIILFLISAITGFMLYRSRQNKNVSHQNPFDDKNPLEFRVAIIFSLLYILFSALTQYAVSHFGTQGLKTLSVVVGFTDIDPFLLNLFQGQYQVAVPVIAIATLQACASNNVLKTVYAMMLGGHRTKRYVSAGFSVVLLFNIMCIALLYLFR